jgi:hypothetical protein
MKFIILLNLFIFLNLFTNQSYAADISKTCENRIQNSSIKKEKKKPFCECWYRNITNVSSTDAENLKKWSLKKMTNAEFEAADDPFSEMVYNVQEECLADANYGKEKSPKTNPE